MTGIAALEVHPARYRNRDSIATVGPGLRLFASELGLVGRAVPPRRGATCAKCARKAAISRIPSVGWQYWLLSARPAYWDESETLSARLPA